MIIRTPADLGALIRDRRSHLGMDQASLAKSVGTSRKWLIEVEKGKPTAQIGLILRTLRVLKISLSDSQQAAGTVATLHTSEPIDIGSIIDTLKRPKKWTS
ncbi:MAG TPA: helix-turn-helix domain-containing protein [Terracidiphilus sp.]|nr:helix-turn-helix domain-containing protein [Terracidiphilus sp.]